MIDGTAHDPGGRVRLRLMPGVNGDAQFSDHEHRQLMRRWLGDTFPGRFIMFIGMNPSTADATVNDPTCAREWTFAQREGYDAMVKGNVGDYRATDPKMLLAPGVVAVSSANLPSLRNAAARADKVVLAHGKLNKALAPAGRELVETLRADNIPLWCFGTNADGSPKMLLAPGVVAVSPANLPSLRDAAARADKVVLAHGKLNKALAPAGLELVNTLRADNIPLWCFGTNADGSPKHPLYLRLDTPLVPFNA